MRKKGPRVFFKALGTDSPLLACAVPCRVDVIRPPPGTCAPRRTTTYVPSQTAKACARSSLLLPTPSRWPRPAWQRCLRSLTLPYAPCAYGSCVPGPMRGGLPSALCPAKLMEAAKFGEAVDRDRFLEAVLLGSVGVLNYHCELGALSRRGQGVWSRVQEEGARVWWIA